MHLENPSLTVDCYKNELLHIIFQNYEKIESDLNVEGDKNLLIKLSEYMQPFDFFFNIIEA